MKQKQASFAFVTWGGKRGGAGRPREPGAKLRHEARAPVAARFPSLVTLRALPDAPNLRRVSVYAAVDAAFRAAREREDFRVVHFSVQGRHLHLLVEAAGLRALSRGMQGLAIRIARGVNRVAGRTGKLWADRFHARALRTPREVRAALCYVLQNTRRHATTERTMVDSSWIDPRSSGRWFDGWRDAGGTPVARSAPSSERVGPSTSPPRTWLLAIGWRRHGLIRIDEVPPAAFA